MSLHKCIGDADVIPKPEYITVACRYVGGGIENLFKKEEELIRITDESKLSFYCLFPEYIPTGYYVEEELEVRPACFEAFNKGMEPNGRWEMSDDELEEIGEFLDTTKLKDFAEAWDILHHLQPEDFICYDAYCGCYEFCS